MEKKFTEIDQETAELQKEYNDSIKASVADGSYFKDAANWYFFRYVLPVCDRTLLIFGAIIAAVVLFFLVQMVQSAFPLVQKVPVFIHAKDQSRYFPSLVALKPKPDEANYDAAILSIDEAVLKYLISIYVKDRESYDFSDAEIDLVNRKFNRIKNTSSADEYRAFQIVMSKDNPDSPIHQFGRDVARSVEIESVKLIKKEPQNFAEKAKEYLAAKIPKEAEVRFISTTKMMDAEKGLTEEKSRYIAKVNFNFAAINRDQQDPLSFTVNGYKLFKVKD